jgi:hypothetical protein
LVIAGSDESALRELVRDAVVLGRTARPIERSRTASTDAN